METVWGSGMRVRTTSFVGLVMSVAMLASLMVAAPGGAAKLTAATRVLRAGAKATITIDAGNSARICEVAAHSRGHHLGPLDYRVSQPIVVIDGRVPANAQTLAWTLSVRCASSGARIARQHWISTVLLVKGHRRGATSLFARRTLRVRSHPRFAYVAPEPELKAGGKGGYSCASAWDKWKSVLDASTYCTGYCTWFVWQMRPEAQLQGLGNADTWYQRAKDRKIPTGNTPVVGAVAWWGAAPEGHVAYVVAVNSGSVRVKEMNVYGWSVEDERTFPQQGPLPEKYIYGGPAGGGPTTTPPPPAPARQWNGAGLGMGPLGSAPTAGADAAGEQFVFWKGTDGHLWEGWYSGGHWNGPVNLNMGILGSGPSVAVDPAGEQFVFWKGTDGHLWEGWYSGGHWNGPVNLGMGTLGSGPSAGADSAGEQFVFWKGTDGGLWEGWYSGGRWNGPVNLNMGTLGSGPGVAVDPGGEQFVFWQGTDGGLWEGWYSGGHWNGSVNLNMGTLGSGPSAGADAAGEQFVFWKGTDGHLWEGWYSSGRWNGSVNLGMGTLGSGPGVAVDSAGEQFVFWQGTEANLWEAWY